MITALAQERILSENDFETIDRISIGQPIPEGLKQVLETASLVPTNEMPDDAVGLGSRIRLECLATHKMMEMTICRPAEANAGRGLISICTPAGAALIGLRTGQVADWSGPTGDNYSMRVAEILGPSG